MSVATDLDRLAIDTIRTLSIDAVQKANSGHPGAPMGAAPMAYVLWTRFLRHAPTHPDWADRDRFVLSAGHASMLLYSLLHLTGYEVSLDDLRAFRQWGSITPGHPEHGLTPGVEATTGPLGQGFADAVGMAIAERRLAARVQPAGASPRRSPHVRHRLRRRPAGGHRVRGGQPRRPPPAGQAGRPLRRQPHPARRADGDGLLRGRPAPLRCLRLAHPAGRRRQRPRGDRGVDRGGPRGPAPEPHRRADAHRLRQPEQAGQPEGPRIAARPRRGPADQGGLRLGPGPHVLRARRGGRAVPAPRSRAGEALVRDWEAALRPLPGRPSRGRRRVPAPDDRRRAARRLGRRPQALRDRDRGRHPERQPGRDRRPRAARCPSCSAAPPTCRSRT